MTRHKAVQGRGDAACNCAAFVASTSAEVNVSLFPTNDWVTVRWKACILLQHERLKHCVGGPGIGRPLFAACAATPCSSVCLYLLVGLPCPAASEVPFTWDCNKRYPLYVGISY